MTIAKLVLQIALFAGFAAAAGPCCGVTAIDTRAGVVTAKENATGRIFQFSAPVAVLGKLRIGQGIYANFGTQQVSVDGVAPCCGILAGPLANAPSAPATPCCGVVSVDIARGVATARENVTGRTFNFMVADAALLKSLQGRSVFANFQTNQVSVDGITPCCGIVSTTDKLGAKPAVSAASAGIDSPQIQPCCGVTAIDTRVGVVTAKENASGRIFQFSASAAVLGKLRVGQAIYANFGTQQVSVENGAPCCGILASPLANSSVANSPAKPADPCCGIVSVDTVRGVATARDNTTGRTFDFRVVDPALLKSLSGRSVFANFQTNQVSVDGIAPCCTIVSTTDKLGLKRGVSAAPASSDPPQANPCCAVTSIDAKAGVATARDLASGRVFQFSASAEVLRTLRLGQSIYADYARKNVSVIPGTPCCGIR
jgi:hypothetical protein